MTLPMAWVVCPAYLYFLFLPSQLRMSPANLLRSQATPAGAARHLCSQRRAAEEGNFAAVLRGVRESRRSSAV